MTSKLLKMDLHMDLIPTLLFTRYTIHLPAHPGLRLIYEERRILADDVFWVSIARQGDGCILKSYTRIRAGNYAPGFVFQSTGQEVVMTVPSTQLPLGLRTPRLRLQQTTAKRNEIQMSSDQLFIHQVPSSLYATRSRS